MTQGYTLIELVVVMVIAGVCAAVALPAFVGGEERQPADRASASISGVIRTASKLSTRDAVTVRIAIDGSRQMYTLEANGLIKEDSVRIPQGVRLQPAISRFAFMPDGSASGDSIVITHDTMRIVLRISQIGEPRARP